MTTNSVSELRYITQSESRARTLVILSEAGELERAELESRLDASHRTVVRVVKSLRERGYLREIDGSLRLTPFGSHVADELDGFLETTDLAVTFRPLLRHAPPALETIDLEDLEGAELLVASESDPFSILDRILTLRSEATRIREVAPGVQKESVDQLAERIRSGEDIDVEAVIPRQAGDIADSRTEYRDGHAVATDSDDVDIYVHPDQMSFFAGVADGTAMVSVSRNERPYALAISENPALRATVESIFETYREQSTLKTPG
jgi:predicted transcriptional regulator